MKPYRLAKIILLILIVIPLAILFFGGLVMLLWNAALAPVLHVSAITFWQAVGILVLAKILFGSFRANRGPGRSHWRTKMRERWDKMTPEQKEKLRSRWGNRYGCWDDKPWQSQDSEGPTNPEPGAT